MGDICVELLCALLLLLLLLNPHARIHAHVGHASLGTGGGVRLRKAGLAGDDVVVW